MWNTPPFHLPFCPLSRFAIHIGAWTIHLIMVFHSNTEQTESKSWDIIARSVYYEKWVTSLPQLRTNFYPNDNRPYNNRLVFHLGENNGSPCPICPKAEAKSHLSEKKKSLYLANLSHQSSEQNVWKTRLMIKIMCKLIFFVSNTFCSHLFTYILKYTFTVSFKGRKYDCPIRIVPTKFMKPILLY